MRLQIELVRKVDIRTKVTCYELDELLDATSGLSSAISHGAAWRYAFPSDARPSARQRAAGCSHM